jgi:N-acetylglucosaminyl-diphospho-decaprenol L-rhamnosyltransferase
VDVDLAIVIVTYNSRHVIEALLDSLPLAVGSLTSHVVVVDNDSTDGTAELVEQRGDCVVVRSTNDGYSAGINRGCAAARPARATLILNPDVRLVPGAAAVMFDCARTITDVSRNIGIVAPQIRDEHGRLHRSLRREPTLLRALGLTRSNLPALSEYVGREREYLRSTNVDWALGAALLITAECRAAVGDWDESFFLYSEETDFCRRARAAGFVIRYEPTAVAVHIGAQSGVSDDIHSMQILNRVRDYTRRHGTVASWSYFGLAILNEAYRIPREQRHRHAVVALLRPGRRPRQLDCSHQLLPR